MSEIDLAKPINNDDPQPFWRGSFTFEVYGGEVVYRKPDRPEKPQIGYPNHLTISLPKQKALEIIQILAKQAQDEESENCSLWLSGELVLDDEE